MKPLYPIGAVLVGLLLASSSPAAVIPTTINHVGGKPVMQRNGTNVLFYGVQYWGLNSPNTNNWDADLDRIKNDLKLNGIRLNIGWNLIETADGVFDFSRLDALLDKVETNGLMVYLQLNQSAFKWTPAWFDAKFPNSEVAAYNVGGSPVGHFSFASPVFKQHYERYVTYTITHVRDRSCIVAYSVFTEPHNVDNPDSWLDYCEYNKAAFRVWLQNRYSNDISLLNTAWGASYGSFSAVQPYGAPPGNWEDLPVADMKKFLDWRTYNCVVKTQFIDGIIQNAKQIDVNHLYGQNMIWKWTEGYAANVLLEPEINYAHADIIGINVYPLSANADKIGDYVNFIMTLHNNQKIVWLGEFNNKSGGASVADLTSFCGEAYAEGATGWGYFNYQAQDDGGSIAQYGIVDGTNALPAYTELKNYIAANVAGKEQAIINTAMPEPNAYVLWSQADLFLAYLAPDRGVETYRACRTYLNNYGKHLAALTENRFVNGDFDFSIPLIVPSPIFLNESVENKIGSYVPDGLSVFITGRYGEYIVHEQLPVENLGYPRSFTNIALQFASRNAIGNQNINWQKNFYLMQTADPNVSPYLDRIVATPGNTNDVLAKWTNTGGLAAVIAQQVGYGRVMYCGTHMFDFQNSPDLLDFNGRLLASFLLWSPVQPTNTTISSSSPPVLSWTSLSNQTYTVLWTTNLLQSFQPVATNIAYPVGSYTDSVHAAESTGFYRVLAR